MRQIKQEKEQNKVICSLYQGNTLLYQVNVNLGPQNIDDDPEETGKGNRCDRALAFLHFQTEFACKYIGRCCSLRPISDIYRLFDRPSIRLTDMTVSS